jgi:regulator of replication initiation timing
MKHMASNTERKQQIQSMIQKASALEMELVWIPKIMARQTQQEQAVERTIEHNEVGLNGYDASFVSSIYRQIQQGAHLTNKQFEMVRRTLLKYWKQYASMMVSVNCRASVV